jgi:peptidyl-prolyl cis-trans isomerase C
MRLMTTSRAVRRRPAVACLAFGLAVGLAVGVLVFRSDRVPDGAAFRLGDRAVTIAQVEERVDMLRALYGVQPPREGAALTRFRRDSAKAVAVSLLLDDAARERDIVIADKTARDVLTRFVESQFAAGGRAAFVQALGTVGTSEGDVLAEIRRQLAVSRLFDEVTGAVKVSDAEVRAAFTKRRDDLGTPERRRLRNIVVASRGDAGRLLRQLRRGADFAELARRHSLDASTRAEGGGLGLVGAADLDAAYARTAFAGPAGTAFGPVHTASGWNVGRVEEIVPAEAATFAGVAAALREQVQTEQAVKVWRAWLAKEIRRADIRYADAYRPSDPDAAPEFSAPPTGAAK